MIKGITLVHAVASSETFDQLSSLLAALGFEPGKGWNENTSGSDSAARGAAFLAPLGNLELVTGRLPATPRLLIEVAQLEPIHAGVQQWMQTQYRSEEVASRLSEIV